MKKHITEGYFNKTELTNDDIVNDVNSINNNQRFHYSLKIGRHLNNRDNFLERYIKTINYLNALIDNSYFIDDYQILINEDYDSEVFNTDNIRTEEEIKNLMDKIWEDDLIVIDIKFSKQTNKVRFSDFSKFLTVIIQHIESLMDDDITYISLNDTVYIDKKDDYYSSVIKENYSDIYHNMFKQIFGITEWYAKCNLHYTGISHLSKTSEKTIKDIRIGDYLYANDNNELVVFQDKQDDLQPIAVCIMSQEETKKNCVIFAALKFASVSTPDTGTIYRTKGASMYFGGDGDGIGCRTCDSTRRYSKGGVLATQEMYDYLNNRCYDKNWKSGILTNSQASGYLPVALATWRFHTKGTKRGQWYIGSFSEYQGMFDKKHKNYLRNELRQKYAQLSHFNSMWTCEELNDKYVYRIMNGEKEKVSKVLYTNCVIPLLKVAE